MAKEPKGTKAKVIYELIKVIEGLTEEMHLRCMVGTLSDEILSDGFDTDEMVLDILQGLEDYNRGEDNRLILVDVNDSQN